MRAPIYETKHGLELWDSRVCTLQIATSADPDLKVKLQSVEQNLEQLTAQLAEARDSVERSNAAALEAHSRSEQLERELGEASSIIAALETSVNMLSTPAAEQIDYPNSDPESRHGRSSVSQEVRKSWNIWKSNALYDGYCCP